jgi:uncharacterized protein with PQ loop repeat
VTFADLAVVTATLLAWSSLVPQIRKLAKTGDIAGVSANWPAMGFVTNAAWTSYLLSQRLWLAAPSTAVMVGFYALVLWMLGRSGAALVKPAVAGAVWAAGLAVTGLVGGWGALGIVLGWSYAAQLSPQVWTAYRTWLPSGIAPGTWTLVTVEAALWWIYGWWFSDTPIMIYATVGMTAGILILIRYAATRRRTLPAPA